MMNRWRLFMLLLGIGSVEEQGLGNGSWAGTAFSQLRGSLPALCSRSGFKVIKQLCGSQEQLQGFGFLGNDVHGKVGCSQHLIPSDTHSNRAIKTQVLPAFSFLRGSTERLGEIQHYLPLPSPSSSCNPFMDQ